MFAHDNTIKFVLIGVALFKQTVFGNIYHNK